MGEVVNFPWHPLRGQRRMTEAKAGTWTFASLNGARPLKHPELQYGPDRRVTLEVGQVWVWCECQELWVIKKLNPIRKGFYINDVTIARYRLRVMYPDCIPEGEFRMRFQVWDAFAASRRVIVIRPRRVATA